jgi:putative transposase
LRPGPAFYVWKAKYGGMEVSEARRLKALEDENTRLKRLTPCSTTSR